MLAHQAVEVHPEDECKKRLTLGKTALYLIVHANKIEYVYDPARAAKVDPSGGFIVSGGLYNGVVLPGTGFPPEAQGQIAAASIPGIDQLFHNLPRGFSGTDRREVR